MGVVQNAKDQQAEERAFDRMISVLPSSYERKIELSNPIDQDNQDEIKTVRYKHELNQSNNLER